MKRIFKITGFLTVFTCLSLFLASCGTSTQIRVSNQNKGHHTKNRGVNYDVRYDSYHQTPPPKHRNIHKYHKKPVHKHKHGRGHR